MVPQKLTKKAFNGTMIEVAPPVGALLIEQDTAVSQSGGGGTGGIIWNASLASAAFLVHLCETDDGSSVASGRVGGGGGDGGGLTLSAGSGISGLRVLELGSGTGVLGLAAAALGAHVLLTDQRNVVPLLERNIEGSGAVRKETGGSARATEMNWNMEKDRESMLALDKVGVVVCVAHVHAAPPCHVAFGSRPQFHVHTTSPQPCRSIWCCAQTLCSATLTTT